MTIKAKHPLTRDEFDFIYSKVPRLCVEVILITPEGVVLTRRTDPPAIGDWHLPGGTVHKGERLVQTVERILAEELQLAPEVLMRAPEMVGVVEYDFSAEGYAGFPVGVAYVLHTDAMPTLGRSASEIGFFALDALPKDFIPEQKAFIEQTL